MALFWEITPSYAGVFIDWREDMASEDVEGLELLRSWEFELREAYLDIRDDLLDPQFPILQNTDGDPLQLTTLHYELKCTPQEAKDALAPLALGLGDYGTPETDSKRCCGNSNGRTPGVPMTRMWMRSASSCESNEPAVLGARDAVLGARDAVLQAGIGFVARPWRQDGNPRLGVTWFR